MKDFLEMIDRRHDAEGVLNDHAIILSTSNIGSVGIYVARQGKVFTWPLADFLYLLTGDATIFLPQLREEFRTICQAKQLIRR